MLQGEWGDHIKWMFVPTAKDNRLLPAPVLMKQTLDGEWLLLGHTFAPSDLFLGLACSSRA